MDLIIGGAFQGKTEFALKRFGLSREKIFTCTGTNVDFSKPCISGLAEFTYACVKEEIDPVNFFREHRELWENSVLILEDISAGVVPMEAELRLWREKNGRLGQYLTGEAQGVYRVFCGLGQKLK